MEKRKINHIYWFAFYNLDSPSVRYRAEYPLEFAKEQFGITSDLIIPGYSIRNLWAFISAYLRAFFLPNKNSLIVIQRVRTNFIYANLLKLLVITRKKLTVYDLDDADYLKYKPNTIHFFARNCNSISAGSNELVTYLKKFNKNVLHVTSPTPDYEIIKSQKNELFTIGWIGAYDAGHKDSLNKYLFPALKKLDFELELVMIGIEQDSDQQELIEFFNNYPNIKLKFPENINWKDERLIQKMIKDLDVGIATLRNQLYELAKSGIKAKQYMNCGVPVICNDLPENINVVSNGLNGFICSSDSEFAERLAELRDMNNEEYQKLSSNARSSIKNFNHWKYFEDLEKLNLKF